MKIEITQTKGDETIILKASGWLLIAMIRFRNHHDHIQHKIKTPKSLGGFRLIGYYPPEYIKGEKKHE